MQCWWLVRWSFVNLGALLDSRGKAAPMASLSPAPTRQENAFEILNQKLGPAEKKQNISKSLENPSEFSILLTLVHVLSNPPQQAKEHGEFCLAGRFRKVIRRVVHQSNVDKGHLLNELLLAHQAPVEFF